jgi:hypothetical protein
VPAPAAGADLRDQREHEVLRGDARRQFAGDGDGHLLGLRLRQRLRGQHVLDLAGADAERQRAERAVRGRVRVAADDGHAGLGEPELRPDDVHDSLLFMAERVQPDAEVRAVLAQRLDLRARDGIGDREQVVGGRVVVFGGDRQIGPPHRTAGHAQPVERLRAGDLVQQVQVDVEQVGLAVGLPNHVSVPNLLRERARGLVSRHLDILKFGR